MTVGAWKAWLESASTVHAVTAASAPMPSGTPLFITQDSRALEAAKPGARAFVALPGNWHDGHAFLEEAHANGARYFLVSDSVQPPDLPESDGRQLLASLRRLAGLSASAIVLPGHNYAMDAHSTIGQEKKTNGAMLQAIQHARAVRSEHAAAGGADVVLLPDYLGVAETALRETDLEALPEMPCCIEADLGEADLGEAPWLCAFCDGPTPGASCGPGCGVACAHGIMPQSVTCAEKSAEKMVTNPSRL